VIRGRRDWHENASERKVEALLYWPDEVFINLFSHTPSVFQVDLHAIVA